MSYPAPGTTISYAAPGVAGLEQHVWMQSGILELTVEGTMHRLEPGDCLRFRLFGATRFAAPGPDPARYALIVCRP